MNPKPPKAARKERSTSSGKIANRLVALSSAAVLTVYAAGYVRTRAAAQRLEAAERPRFVVSAAPIASGQATSPAPSAQPATPAAPNPAVAAKPASNVAASTAARSGKPRQSSPAPKTSQTATATPALAPTETPTAPAVAPVVAETTSVVEPPAAPAPPPQPQYKDGTYSGWGSSRHGDIQATVVIEGGHISSAVISQCWTRYSCSWVAHLQGQVVTRQSPEVDYVSGATQSVNAFYYAVVEALSKAK